MARTNDREWLDGLEAGLLIAAAPFLLFPGRFVWATGLACLAVALIWLGRGFLSGRFLPVTPFNGALLVWLGAVLVGILVSADPDLTLPKTTGILLGVTVWRMLVVQVRTAARQQMAVGLFLVAAAVMLMMGMMAVDWRIKFPLFTQLRQILPAPWVQLPESPAAGVQANQLAGTILLCWPFSLALVAGGWPSSTEHLRPTQFLKNGEHLRKRLREQLGGTWIRRGLVWSIVVGGAVLLLLSQSRAGWLGGGAGLFTLVWLNRVRRSKTLGATGHSLHPVATGLGGIFLLLLLIVAGLGVVFSGISGAEMPPATGATDPLETLAFRVEVWRYALEAIGDFPFTGTGLGTFRRVVLRLYPITIYPNPDIAHAHNVFLQMALDTGLPGLVAYLALLGLVGGYGWQQLHASSAFTAVLVVGICATFLAFHLFGLADTIALGAKPGLLWWWLLGLMGSFQTINQV